MTALARIEQLIPSAINPRRSFNQARDTELLESIRTHGVLTPLIVRPLETAVQVLERSEPSSGIVCVPAYEIVAGHRRYAAASELGLADVPVIIRELTDEAAQAVAIVENLQREDLDPIDEARSYRSLLDFTGTHESPASLARKVGKSERHIWSRLALLNLLPEVQEYLQAGRITVAHAEVIAKLTPEDQTRVCGLRGGLWRSPQLLGMFDAFDDDVDGEHEGMMEEETLEAWDRRDTLRASVPVSVRELEAWIVKNVRFDAGQAAQVAPLDFGELPSRISQASEQSGRGRKVISITELHQCPPEARGEDRTFTRQAWKPAPEPCAKTVLGVIVVGPNYGKDLPVCIDKDCELHWADEIRERKRQAKVRERQQTAGGTAYPKDDWEREHQERKRLREVWSNSVLPEVEAAVFPLLKQVKTTVDVLRRLVSESVSADEQAKIQRYIGKVSLENLGAWLAAVEFRQVIYDPSATKGWLKERGIKVDVDRLLKDAQAKAEVDAKAPAKAAKTSTKRRAA